MIPEQFGGAGLGCIDLIMIVEELGRTLTPSPFLGTLLGTLAVMKGGDAALQTRILPQVAAGEIALALAAAEADGREDGPDSETVAAPDDAGWRITGRKSFVIDAAAAQMLVVAAQVDGVRRLFLVDARNPGVEGGA